MVITGERAIPQGGRLELRCLLDDTARDDRVPLAPQWEKDSESLPDHVIVVCELN